MVLAFAVSSAARALLFGVEPGDPVSLALAAACFGLVAALASALPGGRRIAAAAHRRAARGMMSIRRFFNRSRWDAERSRELDAHLADRKPTTTSRAA
jgi:hypothetical protein